MSDGGGFVKIAHNWHKWATAFGAHRPTSQKWSITFLSWPALANNFPSDEKWQHTTLLVLARRQPTSLKENPIMTNITKLWSECVQHQPILSTQTFPVDRYESSTIFNRKPCLSSKIRSWASPLHSSFTLLMTWFKTSLVTNYQARKNLQKNEHL